MWTTNFGGAPAIRAAPGTYPDDEAILSSTSAAPTTFGLGPKTPQEGAPTTAQLRVWVAQAAGGGEKPQVGNVGNVGDEGADAFAYEHLLFSVAVYRGVYSRLWPFVLGTLMRRADAREGSHTDFTDDATAGERLLAGLLHLEAIDTSLCAPWIDRIFAIIASEKTPVGLKIALLEYLGTNRSAPDSMDIIPFLLGRIKHEPHDKTRACAVLALGIMFRMRYGNELKLRDARKLLAEFWGGEADASEDGQPDGGGGVVMTHEDPAVGPLTKVTLALVALQQLAHPPLAAVDHALVALSDDAIPAAWLSIRGGNLFLSEAAEVAIDNVVSIQFLALPLVQKQLDDYRVKIEEYNESKMRFMPARSTVPTLSLYGLWPASFAELLYRAITRLESKFAKQDVLPRLMDRLAQATAEPVFDRLLVVLLNLMLPDPLVEGTLAQELDKHTATVLRQLAFDSRFDNLWQWIHVQPCSDGRRQRQEEAEAKAQAQTDKESPEGEEGKEKEEEGKEEEEEGAKKKEKKWGFEAKGLPATRAALQQYVDAPIPAELVGRKWLPNFDGMDDENWAELGHAYGSAADLPPLIRGLASRSRKVQERCIGTLYGNAIHQGTRYSATPLTAKWIAYLLEYQCVINKGALLEYLIALMVGFRESYVLAGCDGHFEDSDEQATYDEVSKHLAKYISLFSTGDQDIRSYVIFLLAMCPSQWRLVQPLLDAIARDPTQSLCIRASALEALSFVAPVRQAEACSKGEGQSTHADDEAIALAKRTVDLLTSFLPPVTGVVASLRDVAAARLTGATGGEDAGPTMRPPHHLEVLPAELQALVAHKALLNDPATRRYFQKHAAFGICRLIWRSRGISGSQYAIENATGSETEELIAARESVSRVELELELHRWLPAVKQVLVEDLVDPASYTIKDAGTLLELKGDKLAKLYLTKFKLFGTDINSELRELFLAKLADTQLPARVAVRVASELLELTGPTNTGGLTNRNVFEGADEDDEVYDTAGWSDDKKRALSAIVRCGQVWADADEADRLRRNLLPSFVGTRWPTRHGLARALGVPDVPPPTEEELRREAEQKLQQRQSKSRHTPIFNMFP